MSNYTVDPFDSAIVQLMPFYRGKTIATRWKDAPVVVAHTDAEAMSLAKQGYLIVFFDSPYAKSA
jgi:hypothetical protein